MQHAITTVLCRLCKLVSCILLVAVLCSILCITVLCNINVDVVLCRAVCYITHLFKITSYLKLDMLYCIRFRVAACSPSKKIVLGNIIHVLKTVICGLYNILFKTLSMHAV